MSPAAPHGDPSAALVLACALILLVAKLGAHLARRLHQPAVLGELLAGIVLGNVSLVGISSLQPLATDPFLDMLARLGVLVLLFQVGLESTVKQMLKVGVSSVLVAVIGVLLPFFLGTCVSWLLQPGHSVLVHVFIGATLTATSVGITARVLKDLNQTASAESQIILGAAVLDDVLGLVILAVVGGLITASTTGVAVGALDVLWILVKAAGFLCVALVLGVKLAKTVFHLASRLDAEGVLIAVGLAFCFLLSWAADAMGLAAIVGAFAAGLVLEDVHFSVFKEHGEHGLEELVQPIGQFLVPIFFVLMGMRVDLRSFLQPGALLLAGALTLVAIVGKLASGAGARGPGLRRHIVGIGMIPRGEVGLIFANMGLQLRLSGEPVITQTTFSALVIVVVVTTLVTPPWLARSFSGNSERPSPPPN